VSNRVPDLPILGEPLLAEFANTLYVDATTRLDVLDRPSWIAAWLRQAPCAAQLAHPHRIATRDVERLRELRDALRRLLSSRGHRRAADIELINAAVRSTAARRLLASGPGGELEVTTTRGAAGIDRMLSAIALGVVDAVESGTFELHQMCSRPGCNLFFFRDHHRRRYCNARCANADRQARYNARRTGH
jgi:predicted RNA-binding Zn ribbon-like protein